MAKMTLQTLPKFLVVTKLDDDGNEIVLYKLAPNCGTPVPDVLPQGTPIACVPHTETQLFHRYNTMLSVFGEYMRQSSELIIEIFLQRWRAQHRRATA